MIEAPRRWKKSAVALVASALVAGGLTLGIPGVLPTSRALAATPAAGTVYTQIEPGTTCADGGVYATTYGGGAFGAGTTTCWTTTPAVPVTGSIAVDDTTGTVYTADDTDKELLELGPDGSTQTTLSMSQGVKGVAIGPTGNPYVLTDADNAVLIARAGDFDGSTPLTAGQYVAQVTTTATEPSLAVSGDYHIWTAAAATPSVAGSYESGGGVPFDGIDPNGNGFFPLPQTTLYTCDEDGSSYSTSGCPTADLYAPTAIAVDQATGDVFVAVQNSADPTDDEVWQYPENPPAGSQIRPRTKVLTGATAPIDGLAFDAAGDLLLSSGDELQACAAADLAGTLPAAVGNCSSSGVLVAGEHFAGLALYQPAPVFGGVGSGGDMGTLAAVGTRFSYQFDAGTPLTYRLSSGSLPAGLTVTAGGLLSGTPTDATAGGSYRFTVTAANPATSGSHAFTIHLEEPGARLYQADNSSANAGELVASIGNSYEQSGVSEYVLDSEFTVADDLTSLATDEDGDVFGIDCAPGCQPFELPADGRGRIDLLGADAADVRAWSQIAVSQTGADVYVTGSLAVGSDYAVLHQHASGSTWGSPDNAGMVPSLPVLTGPLAVDAAGDIALATASGVYDLGAGQMGNPSAAPTASPATPRAAVTGMAFDSIGELWTVSDDGSQAYVDRTYQGTTTSYGGGTAATGSGAIAIDAVGDPWVVHTGDHRLSAGNDARDLADSSDVATAALAIFTPAPTFTPGSGDGSDMGGLAAVGTPFSYTFAIGDASVAGLGLDVQTGAFGESYAVASGSLPPGLSLDPSRLGELDGTPTTTGTYTFTIAASNSVDTVLTTPLRIVVAAPGTVFVADQGNDRVVLAQPDGSFAAIAPTAAGVAIGSSASVAVDHAGDLYVADGTHDRVVEVPADGRAPLVAMDASTTIGGSSHALTVPNSVAVDGSGDLFVSDGEDRVVELASGGTANQVLGGTVDGDALSTVQGLATDTAGDLFVADQQNDRVLELPAAGGTPSVALTASSWVNGVTVDAAGDLFAALAPGDGVLEEPVGSGAQVAFLTTANDPGRTDTGSLAVDPAGEVVAVDNDGQVQSFAPDDGPTGPVADVVPSGALIDGSALDSPWGVAVLAAAVTPPGNTAGGGTGGAPASSPLTTTTTLTGPAGRGVFGQPETVTATVIAADGSAPAGTVQFSVDGVPLGDPVALVAGVAVSPNLTAAGRPLPVGAATVTAVYTPADATMWTPSDTTHAPLIVTTGKARTRVTVALVRHRLVATVRPLAPGVGVPDGMVSFRWHGHVLARVKLVKGVVRLPVAATHRRWGRPAWRHPHQVNAWYLGGMNYRPSHAAWPKTSVAERLRSED